MQEAFVHFRLLPPKCSPSGLFFVCAWKGESSTTILPPTNTGKFRLLLIMGGIFLTKKKQKTTAWNRNLTFSLGYDKGETVKLFWSKAFKSTLVIAQRRVKEGRKWACLLSSIQQQNFDFPAPNGPSLWSAWTNWGSFSIRRCTLIDHHHQMC